jgi:circadian clock protein KaiC
LRMPESLRRRYSVLKKRSGTHEQSIRELNFDEKGIHLSEPLTQLRGIMTMGFSVN